MTENSKDMKQNIDDIQLTITGRKRNEGRGEIGDGDSGRYLQ